MLRAFANHGTGYAYFSEVADLLQLKGRNAAKTGTVSPSNLDSAGRHARRFFSGPRSRTPRPHQLSAALRWCGFSWSLAGPAQRAPDVSDGQPTEARPSGESITPRAPSATPRRRGFAPCAQRAQDGYAALYAGRTFHDTLPRRPKRRGFSYSAEGRKLT
jgi:hypothetical protein